jgi:cytochrome oxidase Cu insertion factor (SCO1/SenC/PrrC family)
MQQILSNRKLIALGFAVILLSVLFGIGLWKWQGRLQRHGSDQERPLEGIKEFGAVPPFSLAERDGRRISLSDLKGKVWIVNFIYTNCPDTCPIQSARMRQIQEDFENEKDLRLVSITVDPARDTPEVLSEYARRFSADPARWFSSPETKKQFTSLLKAASVWAPWNCLMKKDPNRELRIPTARDLFWSIERPIFEATTYLRMPKP